MGIRSGTRAPGTERYDASSITVLTGLQAVRKRPAMYIGSTGPQGLHHLVFEVVQNAIDEALAGHCTEIQVIIHQDGSCTVEDNGRGIPVGLHPTQGRPACEVVMTTLHAGGKFGQGVYAVAGGLHGVGVSCVNGLSEWLQLDIFQDGRHYQQRYERGEVVTELLELGETSRRGTRIHFLPDDRIFTSGTGLSLEILSRRLQELAFLHPGIGIELEHQPAGSHQRFEYDTGLQGFVAYLNRHRTRLHADPIRVAGRSGEVEIALALQWTTDYAEDIYTYVNSIFTSQGGTHLEGLKSALTRLVNRYAVRSHLINPDTDEKIAGYDVREGLTCVLSVKMPEPEYEGQTKSTLTSSEACEAVDKVVSQQLSAYLDTHPEVAAAIVGKALEASRARAAARRASERARYQSADSIISKEVYKKQFGIRSRNWHESARWITDKEVLGAHAKLCRAPANARVLDACCGSGVVGASFREQVGTIIGLDITPEMIALSKTRLDDVIHGDVYDAPFPDESFDLVVNREVLHLLPRPERPVSEFFRVLKPGGQLIVGQILPFSEVDAAWMFRIFKKKQPLFFNNFTEADFRALLAGAGFVDIEMVEVHQWEDIDLWINTHETPNLHRHEIRDLYYHAPASVRAVHPFEILPSGAIRDCWRWCVFSAIKPGDPTASPSSPQHAGA